MFKIKWLAGNNLDSSEVVRFNPKPHLNKLSSPVKLIIRL